MVVNKWYMGIKPKWRFLGPSSFSNLHNVQTRGNTPQTTGLQGTSWKMFTWAAFSSPWWVVWYSPRNLQRSDRSWTDPEKTWESNSSNATSLGVPLVRSHSIFHWYRGWNPTQLYGGFFHKPIGQDPGINQSGFNGMSFTGFEGCSHRNDTLINNHGMLNSGDPGSPSENGNGA